MQVFTSAPPPADAPALLGELSKLLSQRFGKPERWVMTCLVPGLAMTFAGFTGPTAFVAVKNIGKMTPEDTTELSREICDRLARGLGLPPDRVYIEFADSVDYLWGWNGETFA